MKKIFLLCLLYTIMFSAHSQNDKDELDQIREWVREIKSNIDQHEKLKFNDITINTDSVQDNYSLEGDELYEIIKVDMVKYFQGKELRKIAVMFKGTHENLDSEYYFRNDQLIFVNKVKTIFHRSRWHEEFNEDEKSTLKNRFYFKNKDLVRWVNTKIETVGKMDPDYSKHKSTILHDAEVYRKY